MKYTITTLLLFGFFCVNAQILKIARFKIKKESVFVLDETVVFDGSCITHTHWIDFVFKDEYWLYLSVDSETYMLSCEDLKEASGGKKISGGLKDGLAYPYFEISNTCLQGDSFGKTEKQ